MDQIPSLTTTTAAAAAAAFDIAPGPLVTIDHVIEPADYVSWQQSVLNKADGIICLFHFKETLATSG